MAVSWLGLLTIGVFYIFVLTIGIWASRKSRHEVKKCTGRLSEVTMVGGRNLNIWVSIFTMTATWVGGGFIMGTAELVYDPTKGLLWAVGPVAFSVNMLIEKSRVVVIRVSIVLCGLVGALLATTTTSVALFWITSADVLYSIMTPQVICTLFLSRWVNHYGACCGFVFGLLLRALVGEPLLGLPSVLPLPWDKILENGQRQHVVPFRTAVVVISFATIPLVSQVTLWMSPKGVANSELNNVKRIQTDEKTDEALNPSP